MLKILIIKEIRFYFTNPKFVSVFSTCVLLILLSVFLGIRQYQSAVSQFETGTRLARQDIQERNSWAGLRTRAFREPDPMQIFVSGVSNDIGRLSAVSEWEQVKLRNSPYSDDPLLASFRILDFSFIVQIVLSLLAIMFTYNAINGEREAGTLKLIFANPVPRTRFLMAKFAGSWLGLTIPLTVPLLIVCLMLFTYNVPLTTGHWIRIILLFGLSVLYYTFFIISGIAVSALAKNSPVSLLVLLVIWVVLVLIIPRAGVLTAANFVPVPGAAEVEAQIEGFSAGQWKLHEKAMSEAWERRNAEMAGLSKEQRRAYEDAHMWSWMEEDEACRKALQARVSEYARRLQEEIRNRRHRQQILAFGFARVSPAAAFNLAAMSLSSTGIEMKDRYETAIGDYKDRLAAFTEAKADEGGEPGGIQIMFDSENGFSIRTADMKKTLDISDMPHFDQPKVSLAGILPGVLFDLFAIVLGSMLVFALAWLAFLKYDLR